VRNRRRNTTHQSREVDHLALSSSLCQTGNAGFPHAPTPRPDRLRSSRSDLASDRWRRFSGVGWPRIDCAHRVGVRAARSTETIGSPASSVADGDYLCSERQGRHGRERAWGATSKASPSTIVESPMVSSVGSNDPTIAAPMCSHSARLHLRDGMFPPRHKGAMVSQDRTGRRCRC
jgi:hypothetical protein